MTTSSSGEHYGQGQPTPTGTYIENTVIIQYDPLVQEVRLWMGFRERGHVDLYCINDISSAST